MQFELREIMKRATALVLLAIALVAIVHFWSPGDPQPIATPASDNPARRDSSPAPSNNLALEQRPPPTSALSPERPSATAARIELRAPDTVRRGDTFAVTVDLQALRTMRHLEFSVTYKKSILRLLGSSPGSFVQRNGTSVKFEETSDGYLAPCFVLHEDGAEVARPAAVEREAEELDAGEVYAHAGEEAPREGLLDGRGHEDAHDLAGGELADDLAINPRDGRELPGPVGEAVGPRQPGGLVRLPFRGHAEVRRAQSRNRRSMPE